MGKTLAERLPELPGPNRMIDGYAMFNDTQMREYAARAVREAGVDEYVPEPAAWIVYDKEHRRAAIYSAVLAEEISKLGVLVLPVFGHYEWLEPKFERWTPIDRLPYTWERELGIQWRVRGTSAAPTQDQENGS